nr:protein MIS12 homolog [Leptinotarsa decemlineata]
MDDESRLSADEYEKQYFGFSSTELIEDYREQVIVVIQRTISDIFTTISELGKSEPAKETLSLRIQDLYDAFRESAKSPLEQFENEVRKIFAIPKNVLLDEDKIRSNAYSDEDVDMLKKEIADLKIEMIQERVFLAKCKQMKEIIDSRISPIYEKVNGLISTAKVVSKNIDECKEGKPQKLIETHKKYVHHYFSHDGNYDEYFQKLSIKFLVKN